LLDFPAVTLDEVAERKVRFGQQVEIEHSGPESLCRAYSAAGELVALLRYDPRTGLWQPQKAA